LIGQSFHQQRMTGIDVVMMHDDVRIRSARLTDRPAKGFAVEQIQVERDGKNKHFRSLDRQIEGIQRHQRNGWPETENPFRCFRNGAGLLFSVAPGGAAAVEIGSEQERGNQCSFPPIRPCFVMLASTSTIARTATNAVISEMS